MKARPTTENYPTAAETVETAIADLESARSIAAEMIAAAQDPGADLDALVLRLDLALENLPDRPDRALDDITAAWENLLAEITPADAAADSETPAGTPTPTPGPTATP